MFLWGGDVLIDWDLGVGDVGGVVVVAVAVSVSLSDHSAISRHDIIGPWVSIVDVRGFCSSVSVSCSVSVSVCLCLWLRVLSLLFSISPSLAPNQPRTQTQTQTQTQRKRNFANRVSLTANLKISNLAPNPSRKILSLAPTQTQTYFAYGHWPIEFALVYHRIQHSGLPTHSHSPAFFSHTDANLYISGIRTVAYWLRTRTLRILNHDACSHSCTLALLLSCVHISYDHPLSLYPQSSLHAHPVIPNPIHP